MCVYDTPESVNNDWYLSVQVCLHDVTVKESNILIYIYIYIKLREASERNDTQSIKDQEKNTCYSKFESKQKTYGKKDGVSRIDKK